MDFEKTRKRLYYLSVAMNGLVLPVFLTAVAVLGNATEPVAQWPAEIARFFTPGLPANLVAAGLKFPVQTIMLALVIGAIYWMNRVVKLEDNEQAFQTWLRFRLPQPPPIPGPARTAKIIARIAAFWLLLPVLVLLALALRPGSFSDASEAVTAQSERTGISADTESPRITMCGLRRLGRRETAHITIAAKRERNETGLHLIKGETYTARFIRSTGWRDGDHDAEPHGVEFEGWIWYLAKGVEWLRPYPQGDWFQLIGRIDRGRDVFPILDQQNTRKPFAFRAPENGELVLLVNDVIYCNNSGILTVEVRVGSCP